MTDENDAVLPPQPPIEYTSISGRRYWGLLFLMYIPYFGVIVAIIVAIVQRLSAMHVQHPIVRENARWAANWAISYAFYLIALIAIFLAVAAPLNALRYQEDYPGGEALNFSVWLILVGSFIALVIYCLVTIIRGTVVSERVVHRPALAIPFLRA